MGESGSVVRAQTVDGKEYWIEEIILDPENFQPIHLIIRRQEAASGLVLIPANLVADVPSNVVNLDCSSEVLESFPDYRPIARKEAIESLPMSAGE